MSATTLDAAPPCFDCGSPASHAHHVVPKSQGGTRTVDLCEKCHGLVHGRDFMHHVSLTNAGLDRARAKGVRLGGKPLADKRVIARLRDLHAEGRSLRGIASALTAEGHATARGGQWYASTVRAVLGQSVQ